MGEGGDCSNFSVILVSMTMTLLRGKKLEVYYES